MENASAVPDLCYKLFTHRGTNSREQAGDVIHLSWVVVAGEMLIFYADQLLTGERGAV